MLVDIRVMELLASRICHDLISPVSAINNGVELIEDIGGDVVEEAMKLIGNSATTASFKLRFFRVAYGRAGAEAGLPVKDVRQIVTQYIEGGKITMTWPENSGDSDVMCMKGIPMLLLNTVLLVEETLAYGGVFTISAINTEEKGGFKLAVKGRNAQIAPPSHDALLGKTPIEEITPRTIQAYVTGRFAEQFDLKIAYDVTDVDCYEFALTFDKVSKEVKDAPSQETHDKTLQEIQQTTPV